MEIQNKPRSTAPLLGAGYRLLLVAATASLTSLSSCALFDSDKALSWHAFRSSGQAALSKDDYAGAETSFQAALQEVASLPNERVRAAISLKDLSSVCLHQHDDKLAKQLSDKALALAKEVDRQSKNGDVSFLESELGQSLNYLGEYYGKQVHDFNRSVLLYSQAGSIFENLVREHAANPPDYFAGYHLVSSLSGLGQAFSSWHKDGEAAQAYERGADPKLLQAFPEVARKKLAIAYAELPQISAAEKAAFAKKLGMNITEQQVPENLVLEQLAQARQLIRAQQFPAAQSELLKAQAVAEQLPQPSEQLAEILETLGICYIRQEQFAEAEPVLARALHIFEKTNGGDPKPLSDCLYSMASLHARAGSPEKAEPYALRRRAMWLEAAGPADDETIKSTLFLGDINFQAKKFDASLKWYQEAADQLCQSKSREHKLLARAYTGQAQVMIAKDDYAAAQPLLEKATQIWRTCYQADPQSADVTESLSKAVNQRLGISSRMKDTSSHPLSTAP